MEDGSLRSAPGLARLQTCFTEVLDINFFCSYEFIINTFLEKIEVLWYK